MDKRRWFRNTLLSCQSKLLSQKGRHTFHKMEQERVLGRGNTGNICFDTWCQVLIHMITSTAVSRSCAMPCCRQDDARTNSGPAKHFFLFAQNLTYPRRVPPPCPATKLSRVHCCCSEISLILFHLPLPPKQAQYAQSH